MSSEPNIASIVSDYEISMSPGNDYRDYIMYLPTAEYRLIDMYTSYNLVFEDLYDVNTIQASTNVFFNIKQ